MVPALVFAVYLTITFIILSNDGFSVNDLVRPLFLIISFSIFVFCINVIGHKDIGLWKQYAIVSFIVSAILFLFNYFSPTFFNNYMTLAGIRIRNLSGYFRVSGLVGDPNIFALLSILCYLLTNKADFSIGIKLVFKTLLSILVVLSVSFTGFVLLVLIWIIDIFAIINVGKVNRNYELPRFLLSVVFISLIFFARLLPVIVAKGTNETGGVDSGRIDLLFDYLNFFKTESFANLFFGNGVLINRSLFGLLTYAHNIIADLVFEIGIIGLALYIVHIILSISFVSKKRPLLFLQILPLLIFSLVSPIHFNIYGYFYIMIVIYLNSDTRKGVKNEDRSNY